MNRSILRSITFVMSIAFLLPIPAIAHTGVTEPSGFLLGLGHPFSGLDHILAMLAVGFWAANSGGRTLWIIPSTFVMVMIFGGILGIYGITVPFVEAGIISSVVILGILIASLISLPVIWSILLVGLFALFHGNAHGTELLAINISSLGYIYGFTLATITLHYLGIAININLQRSQNATSFARLLGSTIAFIGIYLAT